MYEASISQINLAEVGAIDISIPLLTYGSGRPVLSLVAGIHGDEVAGLFVFDQLLQQLDNFDGQLRIIPSANPIAQALERRASPSDNLDLNRIFPGNPEGQLPERIAHSLLQLLSDSDAVIDFHSFGLKNPVMAIFANCGKKEVREQSFSLIRAFNPEMIWELDIGHSLDLSYKGALAPALLARSVANFAVEMPANHRMTKVHVDQAVRGIKRVMAKLGMLESAFPCTEEAPIYRRSDVHSPGSGLFYPCKDIMTLVSAGEKIGQLTSIRNFTSIDIEAPDDGMLLQIHDRSFVTTGVSLFSMGIPVERKEA